MRRALRRPQATRPYHHGSGKLRDLINISERPAEVADRVVPGHWEGDLLLGSSNSAIVTLVERTSRFVILIRLPRERSSEEVLTALKRRIGTLPTQLCRSLTWDQGKEMAQHARFTIETGLQIYFCVAGSRVQDPPGVCQRRILDRGRATRTWRDATCAAP
jgi:IS30 family transposase